MYIYIYIYIYLYLFRPCMMDKFISRYDQTLRSMLLVATDGQAYTNETARYADNVPLAATSLCSIGKQQLHCTQLLDYINTLSSSSYIYIYIYIYSVHITCIHLNGLNGSSLDMQVSAARQSVSSAIKPVNGTL